MLFALGVICSFLASGCGESEGISDTLAGSAAGERRSLSAGHGVEIDFRWAPSGSFMKTVPAGASGGNHGEKQETVNIKDGFWIAEIETTAEDWRKVMGSKPGVKVSGGQLSVACVSYDDCRAFLKRLQSPGHGWIYELPTEAQWEYACRSGKNSATDRKTSKAGWIDASSGGRRHTVGRKHANPWALRDLHGNIAEWCRDVVEGPGGERTIPVGSRDSGPSAQLAARDSDTAFLKLNRVGFRLVLIKEQEPVKEVPATFLSKTLESNSHEYSNLYRRVRGLLHSRQGDTSVPETHSENR